MACNLFALLRSTNGCHVRFLKFHATADTIFCLQNSRRPHPLSRSPSRPETRNHSSRFSRVYFVMLIHFYSSQADAVKSCPRLLETTNAPRGWTVGLKAAAGMSNPSRYHSIVEAFRQKKQAPTRVLVVGGSETAGMGCGRS